jgi:hypothetical protein
MTRAATRLVSFSFFVNGVLAIVTAELLLLDLVRRLLLVLGRRVIPTLTLGALKRNDFPDCRHVSPWELKIENEKLKNPA